MLVTDNLTAVWNLLRVVTAVVHAIFTLVC